jgi:hypothetical protein
MRRCASIAFLCALMPLPALADDAGCVAVVQAAPAHPAASEFVALRAQVAAPAGHAVLARAAVKQRAIDLDVVVTDTPQALAGYRRVGDPALDAMAFVGRLAEGAYVITTTTRLIAGGVETPCPALRTELVVTDTGGPVVRVDVIEYYDAAQDRHFMTADAREIAELDGAPGRWSRTGRGFKAYALYASDNRAEAVCRYERAAGKARDGYVLSASYRECAALAASPVWRYDSRAFDIAHPDTSSGECPDGTRAVYRVWNARNGDHRWITDAVLRASLVANGWISEGYGNLGVAMCAPTS